MLSKDDFIKFREIKCSLVESSVLFINSGWNREPLINEYTELLQNIILKPTVDGNFDAGIFALE